MSESSGTPLLRLLVLATVAGVVLAGLALPPIGGVGLAARSGADSFAELPSRLEAPPLPQRSRLLSRDGRVLAEFFDENRVAVPLARIAPALRQAVLAIEDARFYEHGGVDPKGMLRAAITNSRAGEVRQGGSTLTQQYVKNALVESASNREEIEAAREQTVARKLREMRYAVALEQELSKDQILERYLNIAYFGGGAYGAEAAARHFFGAPASRLGLSQAALLAGLVRSPLSYDPVRDPAAARARRNLVLARMAQLRMISPTEQQRASAAGLGLRVTPTRNGCGLSDAPFFCEYVVDQIQSDPAFGANREGRTRLLLEGGLTITTTLDWQAQKAAQRAVDGLVGTRTPYGAAIAMVEPGTGHVLALAQNHRWGKGSYRTTLNYAADRSHGGSFGFQAGSTFKIFTLAAALQQGVSVRDSIYAPNAGTFGGFRNCTTGASFPPYPVANADVRESGTFDLVRGTWESVNTFFVQLERRTGLCAPADIAESMGVRKSNGQPLERVPSLTLGTSEVSPLAMAGAYATFAARGLYCQATTVATALDRGGKALTKSAPQCRQVLDQKIADTVSWILRGVIDGRDPRRTGLRASIGRPVAGKTGTVQDYYAAWFAGYTPQLASAVWVGHPQGGYRHPLRRVSLGGRSYPRIYGGTLPAPIFARAMRGALDGRPAGGFAKPDADALRGSDGRWAAAGVVSGARRSRTSSGGARPAPSPSPSEASPSPSATEGNSSNDSKKENKDKKKKKDKKKRKKK